MVFVDISKLDMMQAIIGTLNFIHYEVDNFDEQHFGSAPCLNSRAVVETRHPRLKVEA